MTRTIFVFVFIVALATPALAEPSADEVARAHYVSAQAYYKQGRVSDALREFHEAYRIAPRPAFHYNIAICHEKLGELDAAIAAYERYLAELPDADDRAAVQDHVSQLRTRLAPPPPPDAPPAGEYAAPPADEYAAPPPRPVQKPVWRRGWFWGVVGGGVALVTTVIIIGAVVGTSGGDSLQTLPGVSLR